MEQKENAQLRFLKFILFTHPFNLSLTYSVDIYYCASYVPGTVLGVRNINLKKIEFIS